MIPDMDLKAGQAKAPGHRCHAGAMPLALRLAWNGWESAWLGRGAIVRALIAMIGALGALVPLRSATAQETGRYFPETGHTVDVRFLDRYDAMGAARILGYPITESFYGDDGRVLQYFENARIELAPKEDAEGLEVRLTALGVILGGWDLALPEDRLPIGSSAGCRYFEESGHQVCHAFLEFYEAHGGASVFGLPITEFRLEEGRIVQYFEYMRFDWFPEAEEGERIIIGPLGQEHFDWMGYDRSLLDPVDPPEGAEDAVRELRVHPSVWKPLAADTDQQQVYLVVSDQHMRPIAGAAVLLTVYLPDDTQMQMMPATDQDGVTQMTLSVGGQPAGTRVDLEYVVLHQDLTALIRDSFFIWY